MNAIELKLLEWNTLACLAIDSGVLMSGALRSTRLGPLVHKRVLCSFAQSRWPDVYVTMLAKCCDVGLRLRILLCYFDRMHMFMDKA